MRLSLSTTISALLLGRSAHAISKISRSGRYLYDESGSRFFIKGIAYQEQGAVDTSSDNAFLEPSTFIDPLAQSDACTRDLPTLKSLGVNVLRIYSVDSTKNHDGCMKTFSDAGIYTIIDLSLPLNGSIDRTSPSWTTNLLDEYTKTIDAFSGYGNAVLGLQLATKDAVSPAPFVKAAARDIKAYLKSKSIPALVGYAAIDGPSEFRGGMAKFLSCDPSGKNSDDTSIDLNYNIPAYFSEYGCVTQGQSRTWKEVPVLFGDQMTGIWSGGVAFSYFPAASAAGQFGMVTISTDQKTVTTSTDFDNLKSAYAAATGPNSPASGSSSSSFGACPASSAAFAISTTLPGTPSDSGCSCLDSALSCQYRPQTPNFTAITGELINYACSTLLPTKGLNCDAIGGNGTTGVYGAISSCDPNIKLSYLMASTHQACSFSGNGTVNAASTAAASAAASSCIANPGAVSTPSSAPGSSSKASPSGSSGSGSKSGNSAVAVEPFLALGGMAVVGLVSAAATLL
ncbi:1,3-beta-glucanosyltransferase [Flagelloscypha sp. PMI_526]|nr:1,3-beta-glucanosyltransferase [Flagelloscypha sp. PMI_526]